MKISPRYDTDPIIRLDGEPTAIGVPFLRQRRRFAEVLATLSPVQWATPSRCEGWRVQDVAAHLTSVDQFWNHSIASGLDGTPTRFLDGFDPKATPATLVDAVRDATPAETLASYLDANQTLCARVESLDDKGWHALAEAPVGHVTISVLTHHALWDSWIHERDVLQPLGLAQTDESDEIIASLRYAAALGPAFALQSSTGRTGAMAVVVTHPEARFLVRVDGDVRVVADDPPAGALVLNGPAVEVLEALSVRAPWPQPIAADSAWLVAGLPEVFEATLPPDQR